MLKETEFLLKNLSRQLIDIDITPMNSWVGITGYTASNRFQVGTHIHCGDESFILPNEVRNPLIRRIDGETVLVFGRTRQYNEIGQNNAWIFNLNGEARFGFSTGGAVENVVVTKDFIVVTYFDEAACYGEGLDVYDFEGKFLFGYEELFGKEAVRIDDCYAAALVEKNQIIFCSYMEFPMVIFDIETKIQQIWKTPDSVNGSHAITKFGDKVYFHRSYRDKFAIQEWQIGSEEARKIGEYESYFTRGLPDGCFISRNDAGYTIISLQ